MKPRPKWEFEDPLIPPDEGDWRPIPWLLLILSGVPLAILLYLYLTNQPPPLAEP